MNTDAIAERYASDGYYIANRLVGDEECDKLKAEALALMRTHARVGASVFVGHAAAHLGEAAVVHMRALIQQPSQRSW